MSRWSHGVVAEKLGAVLGDDAFWLFGLATANIHRSRVLLSL